VTVKNVPSNCVEADEGGPCFVPSGNPGWTLGRGGVIAAAVRSGRRPEEPDKELS